jgi:phosphatidylserine/phosphatidylglycerophosphate/cardiolipin synthase-like enzyme
MFNFALLGRALPHQAMAFRREFFHTLGGYDMRVKVAADQLLMLQAAGVSAPLALPDFLCDFDSTGISAGRRWWVDYLDAEKNRRQMDRPVTGRRSVDTAVSLTYAIVRQIARFSRNALSAHTSPRTFRPTNRF